MVRAIPKFVALVFKSSSSISLHMERVLLLSQFKGSLSVRTICLHGNFLPIFGIQFFVVYREISRTSCLIFVQVQFPLGQGKVSDNRNLVS